MGDEKLKLRYCGHPLVDVGLATITSFANKIDPGELIEADLEAIADYMAIEYTRNPMRGYLTVAFPNSGFTQPAYFEQPDKQNFYKEKVLRSFRANTPRLPELDLFMGLPVVDVSLDVTGNLPPGHAYRQHIPLLTGEDVINFHPNGEAGTQISGEALLAIQALPLGSAKCGGRMLFVHSDNSEIMQYFAAKYLEGNRLAIQLAQSSGSDKMPETEKKYRTLLIHTLWEALRKQTLEAGNNQPFSITVYHLSNSGQGASLDIYYFPNQIISFLRELRSPTNIKTWERIVNRAWEITKVNKRDGNSPAPTRNYLYDDLFSLSGDVFVRAPRFIRTYFLRHAVRFVESKTDPRGSYSIATESDLVSWKLTELFLRRIVNMEKDRIEQIRILGDALANYIQKQNDKRFFRAFYTTGRYDIFRTLLIKVNNENVKRGNPPFLTLDNYLAVFEESEEMVRFDWRLARDLVIIRMVESLYANGWLSGNQDMITDIEEENNQD